VTNPSARPELPLAGGVANAGAVVRVGDHVLRPATTRTPAIHDLLRRVRAQGFDGVPEPVGIDDDGRERLVYVDGDVPVPPYPDWAQTDGALVSVARLLRRYHDAVAGLDLHAAGWNTEMADPDGGPIVCHNDVCLENVVFRDGEAVALLDFEFAAPGRPLFDVAAMARMCVPTDPDSSIFGWAPNDAVARLRLVADAYGCAAADRAELLDHVAGQIARGGAFVAARVAAGEQAFVEMWEKGGGMARFDRRRAWFAEQRGRFEAALA
jgi:hypothetical protein